MAPPGFSGLGKCELIGEGGVQVFQAKQLPADLPFQSIAAPHKSYHSSGALEGLISERGDGERKL